MPEVKEVTTPHEKIEREILERHGRCIFEDTISNHKVMQVWAINGSTFIVLRHDNGGYELYKGTRSNSIDNDIEYLDRLAEGR
jgi:hypothetical protein